MVAPECAPVAKAGGLGDVLFGLSRELEIRGHAVEIVLPMHGCMRHEEVWDLQVCYESLQIPWYGGMLDCTVWFGHVHGRKCFFIQIHPEERFFGRSRLYGHFDDVERFTAFSKAALEFMYKAGKRPEIIHCLGRLDDQKGMHLVHHALFYSLANDAQFVLIGDAVHDNGLSGHFRNLKRHVNDNPDCHLEVGYSEDLAHLVYAGADVLVVPSMFEPCGLAPMVGMRYGTVPVVRAVGGMVDTVRDNDHSAHPPEERNGYAFQDTDHEAIESGLGRARRLWFDQPAGFRHLIRRAMGTDHSWKRPGEEYAKIYEYIRHR